MLGRDAFRKPPERRRKLVEIPELGTSVYVQSMTARERGVYEVQFIDKNGSKSARMVSRARELMAIASCVDEEGKKIFTPDDLEMLGGLDAVVLDRIYMVAQDLAEVEKIEAIEKN
jgi:hypothetical protein